jgi:hypothetical protein
MTKRGTVVYYLAAWVIGCFVISLMVWTFAPVQEGMPQSAPARLLILYFLALGYGAVDVLLFALLLRRTMRLAGTHNIAIWIFSGAMLAAILTRFLLWAGDELVGMTPVSGRGPLDYLLLAVWTAPNALRRAGLWQAPVCGALIAVVLCLVDRAFNHPAKDPSASTPSA